MKWTLTILSLVTLCVACAPRMGKAPTPQSGGTLTAEIPATNAPVKLSLVAPQNPSMPSRTTWERRTTSDGAVESLTSELAPVQVDHARIAWGAVEKWRQQLASYGRMFWAGVALLVVGAAGFIPQVRLIIGRSTQALVMVSGAAMILLAQVMPGNETFILVAMMVALAVWVLARRYGILQGVVLKTQGKI